MPLPLSHLKDRGYRLLRLDDDDEPVFNYGSKWKALLMFVVCYVAGLINWFVIAYIHDLTPIQKPLPDIWYHFVPEKPNVLLPAEICLQLVLVLGVITILLNQQRWLIFTRYFYFGTVLYCGRAICIGLTLLPLANLQSKSTYCAPVNDNPSFSLILNRFVDTIKSGGLVSMGKVCGDHIYSGHTLSVILTSLMIKEYAPKKLPCLFYLAALLSSVSIFGILTARVHYTIDVVIAYFLTSRLFFCYHTMLDHRINTTRSNRGDWLTRIFWVPLFNFIESFDNLDGEKENLKKRHSIEIA